MERPYSQRHLRLEEAELMMDDDDVCKRAPAVEVALQEILFSFLVQSVECVYNR